MTAILRYNVIRKGTGKVYGAYATLKGAVRAAEIAAEEYGTRYVVEPRAAVATAITCRARDIGTRKIHKG